METFGKAWNPSGKARKTSATVTGVGRFALSLGAACLLIAGGLASTLAAATGGPRPTTTGAQSAAATTTTMTASSVLAVSGHGWGHGLGLSQWGAYGYAKRGWTYDRILAHYYTGTTLGPAKVATVRVLLSAAKSVRIESSGDWAVVDASGAKTVLDSGPLVLKAKLEIPDHPELRPPFTFVGKQPLLVGRTPYRGRITVSSDGKLLQAIDTLALESYLRAVVPAEMPSSWSPEALKAQAVAARSYALANLAKGRPFDLYGDTRSQVFGGTTVESPPTDAAIAATKGEVVLYKGKVADTLFFSTSGGRTASALESTGQSVPYLVPVADPYDTLSPYHSWGPVLYDAADVVKRLKLAAPLADLQALNGVSGRVKSITFVSDDESQVTLNGNQLRTALDLRSTWFAPTLLQLLPQSKTITFGGALSLTGVARPAAAAVSLESRPYGSTAWAPAAELALGADGSFATVVRPQAATQYRLAWGTVRAGLAKIAVGVRVTATFQADSASGSIKPAIANAPVQLQSSADGGVSWDTVGTSATEATGAFTVTAAGVSHGPLRVRVAPGHGLAPGLAKPA
jgi:stage II sporulation protein D